MEAVTQPNSEIDLGSRIIKVNHAGEHGAICIYSGQIIMARLTARSLVEELAEFREHERNHREIFLKELNRRNRRRCRSYWFCGVGGFVLGIITGLCGSRAIAATTVAVEEVVLRHLEHQIRVLKENDPSAVAAIRSIIDDERLHHDKSAAHHAANGIWFKLLTPVVSVSTEAVIWLGMHL